MQEKVYPALDRQIALVKEMQEQRRMTPACGSCRTATTITATRCITWTTTDKSPAEIHRLGLDVVADYTAQHRRDHEGAGMTKGTVGERLRAMYQGSEIHRYPNTDAGKEKLLADLNVKVQTVRAKLPQYFGALPKADVIIKRVPKNIEAAAARRLLQQRLRSTENGPASITSICATRPKCRAGRCPRSPITKAFPAIICSFRIQQEAGLPLIRKVVVLLGLYRRLGALCRAAGGRDGHV